MHFLLLQVSLWSTTLCIITRCSGPTRAKAASWANRMQSSSKTWSPFTMPKIGWEWTVTRNCPCSTKQTKKKKSPSMTIISIISMSTVAVGKPAAKRHHQVWIRMHPIRPVATANRPFQRPTTHKVTILMAYNGSRITISPPQKPV